MKVRKMEGLRAIRERRGLTLQQVEDLTGVDGNTISRYERGVLNPTSKTVLKIAEALGVTADELLNAPRNDTWELKLVFRKEGETEGGVIDMSGNTITSELTVGNGTMSVMLGAPFELWEDDDKFDDLIAQLRAKRAAGLKAHKEAW